MEKKTVFYIKLARKNGQCIFLCEEGTNIPRAFHNVDEAKKMASETYRRCVNKKNKSPAAFESVWVFQTNK